MCDERKLKKTEGGCITFRSYCMDSGEIGDWTVEPICENCGNLEDFQVDFGDASGGMTESWYIPVCGLCGRVLSNQQKIRN